MNRKKNNTKSKQMSLLLSETSPPLTQELKEMWINILNEHPVLLDLLRPGDELRYRSVGQALVRAQDLESYLSALHALSDLQYREEAQLVLRGNLSRKQKNYLSLLRHMQMEQEMFESLVRGQTTIGQEIQFLRDESSQHTDLLGHMLSDLSENAFDIVSKFEKENSDLLQTIAQSDNLALHVISPIRQLLVNHELGESLLGAKRLLQLHHFYPDLLSRAQVDGVHDEISRLEAHLS